MADFREHLTMLPEHMRDSITMWIEQGFPHPDNMGRFMRSLLSNDLMNTYAYADLENTERVREWVLFLHNYAPSTCFGSLEKMVAWYDVHRHSEARASEVT